ncbi:MFS transporter [Aeromicrobium ginsengisoli]|nr:MFS transporter [Aeromicrobium ginsengisoli]
MTTTPTPVVPAAPLRQNRNFSLLWLGEGVSLLGNATTAVLLPLLAVVDFGAGAGWMGALTAAAWLPWLVIGLPAGAWVDRMPPRRVMIIADLVAAVALASVPVAWLAGALTLPHLVVVALANGTCTVFFRTAYGRLIPGIVETHHLEQANGRMFGTESAMQVVGPGAGGLMAQFLSAAGGLAVDAVSYVVSAVCLWRIRPNGESHRPTSDVEPLATRIREGIAYVAHDPYLRPLTLIGGLSNLGLTGFTTLLVLFMVDDLALSPSAVGLVMMTGSIGGLLGATFARRLSQRLGSGRASTWLLLCSGPTTLLLPLSRPGWQIVWLIAGLFLVGLFVVSGNVIRNAWRQRYVPGHLMGRAITTSQVVNFGTMPVAAAVAGVLGEHLGLRPTIALMAGIHLLACLAILRTSLARLRDLPSTLHSPR